MGQVTRMLLLLAVVVPVTAYVAGSLASPGAPAPADHSPVILRDAPAGTPTTDPRGPDGGGPEDDPDGGRNDGPDREVQRGDGGEARVVTPKPTPVGEDDDHERDDDDGPDDDDTDDERDDDGDD
jgi:hypothetical protein